MAWEYNCFRELIIWKDKKLSGMILFCLNLVFYLKIFGGYSMITIISWIFFSNISALNFYNFISASDELDTNIYLWVIISIYYSFLEILLYGMQRIKSLENVLQIVLSFILLYCISAIMNFYLLSWVITNIAFGITYVINT